MLESAVFLDIRKLLKEVSTVEFPQQTGRLADSGNLPSCTFQQNAVNFMTITICAPVISTSPPSGFSWR